MYDHLNALQQVVYFTFIITLFGMLAGMVFFFAQKSELTGEYKQTAILSGVITLVAALTYYFMHRIYLDGAKGEGGNFPTVFRYIDWFITVPLMLTKFPVLLGLGSRGINFMIKLVICSLIMLITAFIGELYPENPALHYGLYGVSCAFWLFILYSLNSALGQLPDSISEAKRIGIRRMFKIILIGWVIYPIGYLMPTFGLEGDYRELLYNIGDLINKVGLGVIVIVAGFRAQSED